jgi:transcriptional regulator with XRE-family HTH domain
MNDSLNERLKSQRKKLNITQKELAKRLPFTVTSVAISQWETGQTEPKPSKLRAMAEFYCVGFDWLSTGRVTASDIDPESIDAITIPSIKAILNSNWQSEYLKIDSKLLKKKDNLAWFEVEGDCMSPLLTEGTIIIVDTSDRLVRDGSRYLLRGGDILRMKQLSQSINGFTVKSLNPSYPDEQYPNTEFAKHYEIMGREILKISKN